MLKTAQKMAPVNQAGGTDIIKFSEHVGFNYGILFVVFAVVISMGATFWLFWSNITLAQDVAAKKGDKEKILQQINSPTYKEVAEEANNLKLAVKKLQEASKQEYKVTRFIPELNKRITNDTQINSLNITNRKSFTMSGQTKSYRSVADLIVALRSWPVLTEVELSSVAAEVEDGTADAIVFSLTAKLNPSQPLITESTELEVSQND